MTFDVSCYLKRDFNDVNMKFVLKILHKKMDLRRSNKWLQIDHVSVNSASFYTCVSGKLKK